LSVFGDDLDALLRECEARVDGGERDAFGLSGDERRNAWFPAVRQAVLDAFYCIEAARGHIRSPLEELFLATLWADRRVPNKIISSDGDGPGSSWTPGDPSDPSRLKIEAQAKVGHYSADFVLTLQLYSGAKAVVAVEIDGHDFHEKTKQQAAHDKKRDRFFAAQGLTLLRFTGSEVHKNPAACVSEVLQLLHKKALGQ
jgi:very-short-patch-repair endonuclease